VKARGSSESAQQAVWTRYPRMKPRLPRPTRASGSLLPVRLSLFRCRPSGGCCPVAWAIDLGVKGAFLWGLVGVLAGFSGLFGGSDAFFFLGFGAGLIVV